MFSKASSLPFHAKLAYGLAIASESFPGFRMSFNATALTIGSPVFHTPALYVMLCMLICSGMLMLTFLQNMYPQTESDADIAVVGLGPKSVALCAMNIGIKLSTVRLCTVVRNTS